jgi:mono/diheme cytochrome c family protein
MKFNRVFLGCLAGFVLVSTSVLADDTGPIAATPPVYVPDTTHENDVMPPNTLLWDGMIKETNAAAEDANAHFIFSFTNSTSGNVAILNVHPSCGCTTAELPTLPWLLAPGNGGQIPITVNLAGKSGTIYKTVKISTDKGYTQLTLKINILPPAPMILSDDARAQGMAMAKADRQAVFRGDCATCHVKPAEGKYGQELYAAACGICHEAEHRATMVPDLHALKTPTNLEFWRTWIAHGKPGSLMPAFSANDGGPLNDMQIASIAAYLNATIPSSVPPPAE